MFVSFIFFLFSSTILIVSLAPPTLLVILRVRINCSTCCLGGAYDPAAGEPQIPVSFQEEVHHPQREKETEHRLRPALPLPHSHQWQRTLHQVFMSPFLHSSTNDVWDHVSFNFKPFSSPRTIQIGTDSCNLNSEFCFILKVGNFFTVQKIT